MDDYIKREDTVKALNELCEQICPYSKLQRGAMCGACTLGSAFDVIEDEIPAADVRENVRGEWISGAQDFETGKTHECSICGGFIDYNKGGADDYYFCPYCGASMARI